MANRLMHLSTAAGAKRAIIEAVFDQLPEKHLSQIRHASSQPVNFVINLRSLITTSVEKPSLPRSSAAPPKAPYPDDR